MSASSSLETDQSMDRCEKAQAPTRSSMEKVPSISRPERDPSSASQSQPTSTSRCDTDDAISVMSSYVVYDVADNPEIQDEMNVCGQPGLKKTRLYKGAQAINVLCFIVFIVGFSVAKWRRFETVEWGERRRMEEGLWLSCGQDKLLGLCPQVKPHTGLGIAVQALQTMTIVLTGLSLLFAVCEMFHNPLAKANIFTGIFTALGGICCVISNALFLAEQGVLKDSSLVYNVELSWAFYVNLVGGLGFLLVGSLVVYDNVIRMYGSCTTPDGMPRRSSNWLTRLRKRRNYDKDTESDNSRGDNFNPEGKIESETVVTHL